MKSFKARKRRLKFINFWNRYVLLPGKIPRKDKIPPDFIEMQYMAIHNAFVQIPMSDTKEQRKAVTDRLMDVRDRYYNKGYYDMYKVIEQLNSR